MFFDGIACLEREEYPAAELAFREALLLTPGRASVITNLAGALICQKKYEEALDYLRPSISLDPDNAAAFLNFGLCMAGGHNYKEAIVNYDKALKINPGYAEAWLNRSNLLMELGEYADAMSGYEKALANEPDSAAAWLKCGNAFRDHGQYDESLTSYDNALAARPDYAVAWFAKGAALSELRLHKEAQICQEKAFDIDPNIDLLDGDLLHSKMQICDWSDIDDQFLRIIEGGRNDKNTASPLILFSITDSIAAQKKAAEIYVKNIASSSTLLPALSRYQQHSKIRIGYFSADFRNHPISFLMAELFELHDKSKFHLSAFSLGPKSDDQIVERIKSAFDQFLDVSAESSLDIAKLARSHEIDITVDLGGYTYGGRTEIFAIRAAPVQINYLGYPGTMGAEFIDYIIGDPVVIPESVKEHYSEKVIYLPCYQANDSKREVSEKIFTREELGLPPSGFVFCCFNTNNKFTPAVFDCWMRILKQVENSVLFLYAGDELVAANLQKEAAIRNVSKERIVFGQRLSSPEYLARYRVADLFLDTLPFNAGTTASDALWVGLPVLTCAGEAFAGRMAASLLNAVHLPELITHSLEEYERRAVELATNPEKLAEIKQKLDKNRRTAPLFDALFFTKHLEKAYTAVYERQQAGLKPDHVDVT